MWMFYLYKPSLLWPVGNHDYIGIYSLQLNLCIFHSSMCYLSDIRCDLLKQNVENVKCSVISIVGTRKVERLGSQLGRMSEKEIRAGK